MTHEFKNIIVESMKAKQNGIKSVLASVVALDGSSYRRPGVRMLILENGKMIGAVSGGCVEKEIGLQSESVFKTGKSKMMTYDGRYRLGCEGVLYILLEEMQIDSEFESHFFKCLNNRKEFEVQSYFNKEAGEYEGLGTEVKIEDKLFHLSNIYEQCKKSLFFSQTMPPCFKLVIFGGEHDAVQLCRYAAFTGWEVDVVVGALDSKTIENFPGAKNFIATTPEELDVERIDSETAIVLMTHNFAYDLRHLVQLRDTKANYIGLLGPSKRRDDMLSQFLEYCPDVDDQFLDTIHGPAGLNIGSETPQEIAVSIVSEILAVTRKRNPISLSSKTGSIHAK